MKQIFSTAVVLAASLTFAFASQACEPFPYVGADMQYRHSPLVKDHGKAEFNKHTFSGNAFLGFKLTPNFGFEAGIHTGKTDRTEVSGGRLFHIGHHYSVLGFLPVAEFDLFAGVGISMLRHSYSLMTPNKRTFEQSKTLVRAIVGAQYQVTDVVFVRGSVNFHNTSKFNVKTDVTNDLHHRDTYSVGLGIGFNFI